MADREVVDRARLGIAGVGWDKHITGDDALPIFRSTWSTRPSSLPARSSRPFTTHRRPIEDLEHIASYVKLSAKA